MVFGPGKAELLQHIEITGSITEAAKAMGMSYMRAWTLVKSMDRGWAEPLVRKLRGGQQRGGAELTATGRAVLALYCELLERTEAATEGICERLTPLLTEPSSIRRKSS